MTGPATPQGRPSSQELAARVRESLVNTARWTSQEDYRYDERDSGLAALDVLAARLQATEQALREIDRVLTLHKHMAEDVEDNEAALAAIVGEHPGWYDLAVRDWIHDRVCRALEGATE